MQVKFNSNTVITVDGYNLKKAEMVLNHVTQEQLYTISRDVETVYNTVKSHGAEPDRIDSIDIDTQSKTARSFVKAYDEGGTLTFKCTSYL